MAEHDNQDDVPAEKVAGGSQLHPLAAAALIGVAAGGVFLGTRALARRNANRDGRKLNSVLATAITATDLAAAKPGEGEEKD